MHELNYDHAKGEMNGKIFIIIGIMMLLGNYFALLNISPFSPIIKTVVLFETLLILFIIVHLYQKGNYKL